MAELLFDRRVAVYVDSLRVTDLRCQFKIEKDLKKEPNCSEVIITNLSQSTRAQMRKKGAKVIVEAGYDKTLAQIFYGNSRDIDHVKTGPDWETKIQAGDGESSYRFCRFSESFRGGTPVAAVVRTTIQALQKHGLDPGNAFAQADKIQGQFVNGFTAHGKAVDTLDVLLKRRGFEWSIQDNRLQLLGEFETVKRSAVLLDSDHGLVGSPEHGSPDKEKKKPPVLKARSLLQPEFRPGCLVQLNAENQKGLFKVVKVTHTGDTHSGPWYSDLDLVPTTS